MSDWTLPWTIIRSEVSCVGAATFGFEIGTAAAQIEIVLEKYGMESLTLRGYGSAETIGLGMLPLTVQLAQYDCEAWTKASKLRTNVEAYAQSGMTADDFLGQFQLIDLGATFNTYKRSLFYGVFYAVGITAVQALMGNSKAYGWFQGTSTHSDSLELAVRNYCFTINSVS